MSEKRKTFQQKRDDLHSGMTKHTETLERKIAKLSAENKRLLQTNKALSEESNVLRTKTNDLVGVVKEELKTFQKEKELVDETVQKLEAEKEALETKLVQTQETAGGEVERLKTKLSHIMSEYDRLSIENQALIQESTTAKGKLDSFLSNVKDDFQTLRHEKVEMEERILYLEQETKTLQDQLYTSQGAAAEQVNDLKSIVAMLTAERDTLVKDNKNLADESASVRSKAGDLYTVAKAELDTFRDEKMTMDGKMRQLEHQNTKLRKELVVVTRTATKEVPALQAQIEQLLEEKEHLVEENEDINEECDTLRARADNLVKVAKSQYENFKMEKLTMETKIQKLEKKREALEEELWLAASNSKHSSRSSSSKKDKKKEKDAVAAAAAAQEKVNALEGRIAELVQENETVVAENKRVAEESASIRKNADMLLAAAKDTLETFTKEKKEIEQSKQKRLKEAVVLKSLEVGKQAEKEKRELLSEKRRLETELKSLKGELQKSQKMGAAKEIAAETNLESVRKDVLTLNKKVAEMETEKSTLLAEVSTLRMSEKQRETLQAVVDDLIADKDTLNEEKQLLRDEMAEVQAKSNGIVAAARAERDAVCLEKDVIDQRLDSVEHENETLKKAILELRSSAEDREVMIEKLQALQDENERLAAERDQAQDKLREIQSNAEALVSDAQTELKAVAAEKDSTDQKLKVAEKEKDVLKEVILKLRRSTENLQELEARIGQITADNEALVDDQEAVTVARAELVSLIIEKNAMDQKVRHLENERLAMQEGLLNSNRSSKNVEELEARIAQLQDDKERLAEKNREFRSSSNVILADASTESVQSRLEKDKPESKVKSVEKDKADSVGNISESKLGGSSTEFSNQSLELTATGQASTSNLSNINSDIGGSGHVVNRETVETATNREVSENEKMKASNGKKLTAAGGNGKQADDENGSSRLSGAQSNLSSGEHATTDAEEPRSKVTSGQRQHSSEALQQSSPQTENVPATGPSTEETIRVFKKTISMSMRYHDRDKKEQFCTVKATYTGSLVNGVPHGSGMVRFQNGSMYLGNFVNGCMHGKGAFNHRKKGGKRHTILGNFEKGCKST